MIKEDILKKIAERSGIEFDAFKTALTSDTEVEVSLPDDWHTFSGESIAKRDKSKYEEGKGAGLEMTIKQFKSDSGLEFEGKTLDKLVEAVKTKAVTDANKEPEAKYKELEDKYKLLVGEKDQIAQKLQVKEGELLNIGVTSKFTSELASKGIDTLIPANDLVTLFLSQHEIVDGQHVKKRGSADIIKDDKTLTGLPATDVFLGFAEKYVKKDSLKGQGGEGGDGKNKLFSSFSDYNKWKESAKPDQKIADEVLLKSLESVENKNDFYKE